jgi:hypothetical protein
LTSRSYNDCLTVARIWHSKHDNIEGEGEAMVSVWSALEQQLLVNFFISPSKEKSELRRVED